MRKLLHLSVRRLPLALTLFVATASGAAFAAPETWTHVPLLDVQCSAKARANPDEHVRQCALQCARSGFGVIVTDGAFLTFDEAGNKLALAALKSASQSDHLRVTVTGLRKENSIQVATLTLDPPAK
jgi:hypothetical protein